MFDCLDNGQLWSVSVLLVAMNHFAFLLEHRVIKQNFFSSETSFCSSMADPCAVSSTLPLLLNVTSAPMLFFFCVLNSTHHDRTVAIKNSKFLPLLQITLSSSRRTITKRGGRQ